MSKESKSAMLKKVSNLNMTSKFSTNNDYETNIYSFSTLLIFVRFMGRTSVSWQVLNQP